MGQCCCKVKVINKQLYDDLVHAVDTYRGETGTAAVIDNTGEVFALRCDASIGDNSQLLISLVPSVLRASFLLAQSFGTSSSQFNSTTLRSSGWSCLVSRLPQSRATVILFAEGPDQCFIPSVVEMQQTHLASIDAAVSELEKDVALATAALKSTR